MIARMQSQNGGDSQSFASREEPGTELGDVENGGDEHFVRGW
jgi:hypothetical protein